MNPRCAYISHQKYLIIHRQIGNLSLNNLTKNDNYSGKIPAVMRIFDNFSRNYDNNDNKKSELIYLTSLSFTKLYKFILKFKGTDEQEKIIRDLIEFCYPVLNNNFKKYIGGLHNLTLITRGEDYSTSNFKDIIDHMKNFANLLDMHSPIHNLLITQKVNKYYDDYFQKQYMDAIEDDIGLPTTKIIGNPKYVNTIIFKTLVDLEKITDKIRTVLFAYGTIINLNQGLKFPQVKKIVVFRDINVKSGENVIDLLLDTFPKLQILIFRNCYSSEVTLNITKKNTSILVLKITNANIIINNLSNLTKLEQFEIVNNNAITKLNLDTNFKKLNFIHLEHLNNLEDISISSSKFTLNSISLVGNFENLKNIRVNIKKLNQLLIRDSNLELSQLEFEYFKGNFRINEY